MKESISYTFLLNIVIIFIFTCFAIIMGILSYYKAFRANTIISETIEKYEGYNCLSKEEIARKLNGIGYNTPFKVSCKSQDGKCDDTGETYKVISYNLDFEGNLVYNDEPMNSSYKCEVENKKIGDENEMSIRNCTTNKHYQYGIYTYMYVELPVISNLIKIPVFSKTTSMYEFRNFYVEDITQENGLTNKTITDVEQVFNQMYERKYKDGILYVSDAYYGNPTNVTGDIKYDNKATDMLGQAIMKSYAKIMTNQPYIFMNYSKDGNNLRDGYYIKMLQAKAGNKLDASVSSNIRAFGLNGEGYRRKCGFTMDYSE